MSTYATSTSTPEPAEAALQAAVLDLTHHGFAITTRTPTSAILSGPGLRSTRQNPLLGATLIRLWASNHTLHLDAELGGVDSMRRFLIWFPFLLSLGLGLFFGVFGGLMFGRPFGIGFGVPWAPGWRWFAQAIGLSMLPALPWLVLAPWMARSVRARTERALEILVSNSRYTGS